METRLLACAGEASGDRLAAQVVVALEARRPLAVRGLAGSKMRLAGVDAMARAESITAVGVVEALRAVRRAPAVLNRLADAMDSWQPDLVLTVDSPGLLLHVGRRARRRGIPVVHLVSPQLWAWRPGRARRVASAADAVLCLLPMEPPLYEGTGLRAVFVGHPGAISPETTSPKRAGPPVFGLAPGSRSSEIEALWPVFLEVAACLRRRFPACTFSVLVAPTIDRRALGGLEATFHDDIGAATAAADVFLAASGTVTIELAAHRTPMVVAYRVHPLTWAIGRMLVRGVRHLALPNVLAGRAVVPEHLQRLDPEAIAADMARLTGLHGEAQCRHLAPIVARLRGEGAVERIADEIERLLEPGRAKPR
ncbi:MAG: lipid-A-disaccharide synthase [Deltaproteobacteria bacterium]|nr:lipid-A-disaccharide synthase [Deltaproteobacteria bacterium]